MNDQSIHASFDYEMTATFKLNKNEKQVYSITKHGVVISKTDFETKLFYANGNYAHLDHKTSIWT